MKRYLNTHARIKRALRNNQKIYSATESFKQFKWFSLAVVLLLPIYPTLGLLGTGLEAQAGNYDETTIITAYEGDDEIQGSYINKSGLVSTDFDVVSKAVKKKAIEGGVDEKATAYTVVAGDTLSLIAQKYGISTDSILWANDLSEAELLRPGTIIRIPPVSGVVHKIVKGDTISGISAKYNVESNEIFRVNSLVEGSRLKIGMELMIPGATQKVADLKPTTPSAKNEQSKAPEAKKLTPVPTPTPGKTPTVIDTTTGLKSRYAVKYTGLSRGFAWGNCTYYVAQNKTVTWRGNANAWIKNARAKGVPTGKSPVPGAIIQLGGSGYNRYYGHVGIVADVTKDYIIVKDMNYRRINEVTIRKIPRNDKTIQGYIYVD